MPVRPVSTPSARAPMAALALLLTLFTAPASSQWNVAVGGDAGRTGASDQIGPTGADLRWDDSLPAIVSQQAAIDGDLVVMARIGSFTIPTGTWIVAHELDDGAIRWQTQLPFNFADSWRSRVSGARDGVVYATRAGNTNADYLYALDAANGSILWESVDKITETSTESVTYAPDGDPITTGVTAGGATVLHRIEASDGTTVWSAPRSCPTSGGCDAVVNAAANRVYMFEANASGPKITAVDLTTGAPLYSTPGIGGGFIQQVAPFLGPDGTVYAPRTQNNPFTDFLVAYDDTGAAFVERWSVPMGYAPFASHAIGPDGSVYGYTPDLEIMRLDPATGALLDTSEPVPHDSFQPRMAVDASGKLYLTNGSFPGGEMFVYTPDLRLIWSTPITNVNVGGPAISGDGTLIVAGVGTDVRAYQSDCAGYVVEYGEACVGSGGFVPSLGADGCPTEGGAITVTIADALGGKCLCRTPLTADVLLAEIEGRPPAYGPLDLHV